MKAFIYADMPYDTIFYHIYKHDSDCLRYGSNSWHYFIGSCQTDIATSCALNRNRGIAKQTACSLDRYFTNKSKFIMFLFAMNLSPFVW